MEPQVSNTSDSPMPQAAVAGQFGQATVPTSTSSVGVPSAAVPMTAGDNDLIEKDWVEAAKRIIEENKQDPYTQSRALTALREDYMRKRYGRDIKAAE